MNTVSQIRRDIAGAADKKKAADLSRFFQTHKGGYGEGDLFLGVMMPDQRKVVCKYRDFITVDDTLSLLKSKFHEERMVALLLFVEIFKRGSAKDQERVFRQYLKETKYINNWDLIDVTCRDVVGRYCFEHEDARVLYGLARSKNIWKKRIAIISTAYYIAHDEFDETLEIARMLLHDKHDLIHKAAGWMLREVGKRSRETELVFLDAHSGVMPRTMLRYAIEKLSENMRKKYLARHQ